MLRAAVFAVLLLAVPGVLAQDREPRNREVYQYRGPDRDSKLLAAARKEGALTLYTTMTPEDAGPLLAGFEKKYGVKVNMWRGLNQKLVQRAVAESRAGRPAADAFEGSGHGMEILRREGLIERFWSPGFADIPPEAFPSHGDYAPDNLLFFVMGYNTKLVKPADVPKSYDDLLQPRWAGNLGIEASDVVWFAAVAKAMGEAKGLAYFERLAATRPQIRSGHTLMTELVAAGEIPIALTLYNQAVDKLKEKGAPIEWKALPPAFGRADGIALARQARHPNAALLFADYLLSPEGQRFIRQASRVPVNRKVDIAFAREQFRIIDMSTMMDEWDGWEKRFETLFLKARK
jgi:iron(III) transport system substrate-binding protein